MPGYKRSGKLTMWDGIESNQFLYVTTDKSAACDLAVGSAVEKVFNTDRFNIEGKIVTIYCKNEIPLDKFLAMQLYVYTIPFRAADGFVKNKNPHNNIDTEWLTKNTIENVSVEPVDVKHWMEGKVVIFTRQLPDTPTEHVWASQHKTVVHNQSGMAFP
jgi:hypothetical protein